MLDAITGFFENLINLIELALTRFVNIVDFLVNIPQIITNLITTVLNMLVIFGGMLDNMIVWGANLPPFILPFALASMFLGIVLFILGRLR